MNRTQTWSTHDMTHQLVITDAFCESDSGRLSAAQDYLQSANRDLRGINEAFADLRACGYRPTKRDLADFAIARGFYADMLERLAEEQRRILGDGEGLTELRPLSLDGMKANAKAVYAHRAEIERRFEVRLEQTGTAQESSP